eukprot:559870-Prymnesium_polylepis.1
MDDFRPRELVARCAGRDRKLIRDRRDGAGGGRPGRHVCALHQVLLDRPRRLGHRRRHGVQLYDECRLPPGVKFSKEGHNRVVFA